MFCNIGFAEIYYFKKCKMDENYVGNFLINHDKNTISEIGLYRINKEKFELVLITENNNLNQFSFNNVANGEYLIIGIDGKIGNIYDDINPDLRVPEFISAKEFSLIMQFIFNQNFTVFL